MSKIYSGDRNLIIGFIVFIIALIGFVVWTKIEANKEESTPGIADYKAGHYKVAIQKLDLYLAQNPCSGSSHGLGQSGVAEQCLGKAYLNDHQYQKAIDTFNNPCILSSHNVYWIGEALMAEGKLSEARVAFKRSIKLSGRHEQAWVSAADEKIGQIDYTERQHPRN